MEILLLNNVLFNVHSFHTVIPSQMFVVTRPTVQMTIMRMILQISVWFYVRPYK
jgi:hypothetical protein